MNRLVILILLVITLSANGADSKSDILIWRGDTLRLLSDPLALHPNYNKLSIIIDSLLVHEDKAINPEKYEAEEVEVLSFFAEWFVLENRLYLSNIFAEHDKRVKVDLKHLFGEEVKSNLVSAAWVTDSLLVKKGKCIESGCNPIFETETMLQFRDGLFISSKTYNNYIIHESKFAADPNPQHYLDYIYSQINWKGLPDLKDHNIHVFISVQPDYDGKIDSIVSADTYMFDGAEINTDTNNIFIKEGIRIARLVPDWDVIYHRGKIANRTLILIFDDNQKRRYAQ